MILRDILAYGGMFALELLDIYPGVRPLRANLVVYAVTLDLDCGQGFEQPIRYTMSKHRYLLCSLEQGIFSALF